MTAKKGLTSDDLTGPELDEIEAATELSLEELQKRQTKLMYGTAWQVAKRSSKTVPEFQEFFETNSLEDIEKILAVKPPKVPQDRKPKQKE